MIIEDKLQIYNHLILEMVNLLLLGKNLYSMQILGIPEVKEIQVDGVCMLKDSILMEMFYL